MSAPGGCLLRVGGVSALGGVCSWGCVWGVSAQVWGGVCSRGCLFLGVSAPRGVSALGGICSRGCLLLGGGIPACTEADTPLWTDTSKNITLATTSLRPVIRKRNVFARLLIE